MNENKQNRPRRFHHQPGTDPFKHQATRPVQEATKNDTRSLRRILFAGGVAVTALFTLNAIKSGTSAEGSTPRPTIEVEAKEGDSYWSMQEAEGDSGRELGEVVLDAMDLPQNDQKGTGDIDGIGDGMADEVHPGMIVTLIDDPSTPSQP